MLQVSGLCHLQPLTGLMVSYMAEFCCRYTEGEQVFLCYGKYTNLELLGTILQFANLLH